MKLKKVIKDLQYFIDLYGENIEVNFKMVPPETVCDNDSQDIEIKYYGETDTSLLDNEDPKMEIGFTFSYKADWNESWKSEDIANKEVA